MNMTKIEQIGKTMPEVPEVQFLLQEMKDFINKNYARYLSKKEKDPYTGEDYYPMCPNIDDYLSDVEAIIKDLEIKLKFAYHLRTQQKRENKKITQNATLNRELLDFLKIKAYKPGTYEEIGKKLDKHFYSYPEPLY